LDGSQSGDPLRLDSSFLERGDSAIKRGDHIGMLAPGIIVPVRDRSDRLPFERVAGVLDWYPELAASAHDGTKSTEAARES
jgi:hypothetical protein